MIVAQHAAAAAEAHHQRVGEQERVEPRPADADQEADDQHERRREERAQRRRADDPRQQHAARRRAEEQPVEPALFHVAREVHAGGGAAEARRLDEAHGDDPFGEVDPSAEQRRRLTEDAVEADEEDRGGEDAGDCAAGHAEDLVERLHRERADHAQVHRERHASRSLPRSARTASAMKIALVPAATAQPSRTTSKSTYFLEWVDYEEAKRIVAGGGQWLDVRLPSEFEHYHANGALNIPLYALRLKMKALDRNVHYVVCCDTGRRSCLRLCAFRKRISGRRPARRSEPDGSGAQIAARASGHAVTRRHCRRDDVTTQEQRSSPSHGWR